MIRRVFSAVWSNMILWSLGTAAIACYDVFKGNVGSAAVFAFLSGSCLGAGWMDLYFQKTLRTCDVWKQNFDQLQAHSNWQHQTIVSLLEALKIKRGDFQ